MTAILTNEQIEDEWESVTGYRINKYKYFKEVDTAHLMEFASRLLVKAHAQERLEMTAIKRLMDLLKEIESYSLRAFSKSPSGSECSQQISYLYSCIAQAVEIVKAMQILTTRTEVASSKDSTGAGGLDAIYAAWHGAGVDLAGGDWQRFVEMLNVKEVKDD